MCGSSAGTEPSPPKYWCLAVQQGSRRARCALRDRAALTIYEDDVPPLAGIKMLDQPSPRSLGDLSSRNKKQMIEEDPALDQRSD